MDIRVEANGFVPRYFWGVENPDLHVIELTRGRSLSGTVRLAGKGAPSSEVSLQLKPSLPSDDKRLASRTITTRANERGFFQFAAIEPGQYTLIAHRDGWSTLRKSEIRIREGQETSLDPLTIEPLARVDVSIQPPLDPYGKPWKASLQEMTPLSSLTVPIAEGSATLSGQWTAEGLDSRAHRLDIRDHLGNSFAYSIVNVTPNMPLVNVTIDAIAVRGRISLGDEPLPIRLEFMNGKGTSIAMQSDAEGQYAGALPSGGAWQIMVVDSRRGIWLKRNVSIDRDDAVAEVDVALPDTRLAGKVVSADGTPIAATLKLYDEKSNYIAGTKSNAEGEFQFVGLEPAAVQLIAESIGHRASSGLVPFTVEKDSGDDVTVVLRSQTRFKGRLVTPSGLPVAGAIVRWLRPGMHGVSKEEVSNPNGVFTIIVPQGTPSLDLIILPPAMPAKVVTVALDAESKEIIVGGPAGVLEVEMNREEPLPWLRRGDSVFGIALLQYPFNWESSPRDWRPWGMSIELETGEYAVCRDRDGSSHCVRKFIAPGAIERVEARALLQ
ncbi:MAG TPA: carboxypeptidase regulatory-like domain-containing protein [Thermoanaerobaculia bacterium]|nr:carboxypeptidase regulatory-like domain-containing protein [Thermoanaerobaculia bacterium]